MPLNDFASRGIQCHGMEFRIQGRARSTIPRVRRGASSSQESKDNKGLALKFSGALRFTLSWLVPVCWVLVEQVSREGMGWK